MNGDPKELDAEEVQAPDPTADPTIDLAKLPADHDDDSAAGRPTTEHEEAGWRAVPIGRP